MDLIFRVYNFLKKNGFQLTFKKIINKIKEHYINSKKNKLINRQAKILYLIYDLKHCPVTYNFVDHMIISELDRLKYKCDEVIILFIPGDFKRLREEWKPYEEKINYNLRLNRIYNLILPLIDFLPKVSGYNFIQDRYVASEIIESIKVNKNSYLSPRNYNVRNFNWKKFNRYKTWVNYDLSIQKKVYNFFKIKDIHKEQVSEFLKSKNINPYTNKLITITVRHSPFGEIRNSNEKNWKKFANYLISKKYSLVFINDTEDNKKYERYSKYTNYFEASYNIFLRYGLYSLSYTNCLVSNGTMMILNWSDIPFMIFKVTVAEDPITNPKKFSEHHSVPYNTRPAFLGKNQEWIYDADTIEVLKKEFDKYEKKYEI